MKPDLRVVKPPQIDLARDIYADARAAALDSERWRRMHERSWRREAIFLPDKPVRRVMEPGHSIKEFRP